MTTTVIAKDLRRVLTAAAPGMPRFDDIPSICGIHLMAVKGKLLATSTDRYVAVHAKAAAKGDLPATFVTRQGVRLLLDWARLIKPAAEVTLEPRVGNRLAVSAEGVSIELTCGLIDEWPGKSIRTVFTGAKPKVGTSPPGRLDLGREPLASLHRVLAAAPKGSRARWRIGEGVSPVLVDVEDWLLVAVMPMRFLGESEQHVIYDIPEPEPAAPPTPTTPPKKAAAKPRTRRAAA